MARLPCLPAFLAFALCLCGLVYAIKEVEVPAKDLNYGSGVWNFADTGRYCAQDHYWTRGYTGATVSYTFNGSAIAVQAFKFSDGAMVSIDIDGQKTNVNTRITTYDCFAVIFNSGQIPYGRHTITIRTLDAETFYLRALTYATYDENELQSIAIASASNAQRASQSIMSTASVASVAASGSPKSGGSNTGAIAGGVVGGVLGLGIIIALIVILVRRNKNKQTTTGAAGSPAESGWKPDAQPAYNGQPLPYQATGQTGGPPPPTPGSPYSGFLPNQPTGTSAAPYLGAQATGASVPDRPMSAYSQPGYPMNPSAFQQGPTGAFPPNANPSPAPSGAYQGYPIPMEYGGTQTPGLSTSPPPGAGYPAQPNFGGIPAEPHQPPYVGTSPVYDPNAQQGMYPRQ